MFKAVLDLQYAAAKPVPIAADELTIMLFLNVRFAVVEVAEVVTKRPAVLKLDPVELASSLTVLNEMERLVVDVVVVTFIPLTLGDVVDAAAGALKSPMILLYIFPVPLVPKEPCIIPDTVGAVLVLEML